MQILNTQSQPTFYPATPEHAPIVQTLLTESHYLHMTNAVQIDALLPLFIQAKQVWLAESQGHVWGMVIVQPKDCSAYPIETPDLIAIQVLALRRGRSPIQDVPEMLAQITPQVVSAGRSYQLFVHSSHRWLKQPLHQADFEIVERVQHLQLDRLDRRIGSLETEVETAGLARSAEPRIELRPIHKNEYASLAQLDAATFNPIWHWSQAALENLAQDHRMQVAVHNGAIVGYSAVRLSCVEGELAFAHLARLAVGPTLRGLGLGRRLLIDVLQFAHARRVESVGLNMQTSNQAALSLYERFGFRRTGRIDPIFVKEKIVDL